MTLIKWAPRPSNLLYNVDSMISSIMNDDWNPKIIDNTTWSPAMDIEEKEKKYIINADIPGLSKKDVKISMVDNVLSISGERKHDHDNNVDNYHYRERTIGTFNRSFNLPDTIEEDKVTASCKNGILTVTLPKKEAALPKEREIAVN